MTNQKLPQSTVDGIEELRTLLTGTVALPGDDDYRSAAPWNTAALFEPAAVVFVADGLDISHVFTFAEKTGFRVAVQATGHGATDRGGDTVVVNTRDLRTIRIDPKSRLATIGAGVTADELLRASAEHNLAPVIGSAATVGVVGYLTGGGVGPLASTFGLSADYVHSFAAVTADGRRHHVTPADDPDLFWAFRGGKASLGFISELTLELVPASTLFGGALWFDGTDAPDVLRRWSTWSRNLPREVTTSIALMRLPALPFIPPPLAGRLTVSVRIGTTLDAHDAEPLVAPIREVATPLVDTLESFDFIDIGRIHSEPTDPEPLRQSQSLLTSFDQHVVDALLTAQADEDAESLMMIEVRRLGGALADSPDYESAFPYREAGYSVTALGLDLPGRRQAVDHATSILLGALAPWSGGAMLANFNATSDPERASMAYDRPARERLARLVRTYDPHRLLRP